MKDSFYARLFHESEDYWIPRGFDRSDYFQAIEFDVKWGDVKQWRDLEHGDDHFHQFLTVARGLLCSSTDAYWASRCSSMIEAQLLVVDGNQGRHIGWMNMMSSYSLEGAIDVWRGAIESAAKENLRKTLISFPGWDDYNNLIPGHGAYEQYGFTMMLSFELIKKIVGFIKGRHREIPRYIGGALRLGGSDRARREIAALFEAMELRPHSRPSVIEALWDSRLDKKLYLDHLTLQERGLTLDDALGL